MNFFHKLGRASNGTYLFTYKRTIRVFHVSSSVHADAEATADKISPDALDILDELRKPELSEQEIKQKRFKSRLPERVYREFVRKEAVPIEAKYNFEIHRLRSYYARHGSDSKLNPGLCWPTREEILDTIEYENTYEPPLSVRIKNVLETQLAEEKRKRDVEEEVDKNMANLDKWISEYNAKIARKKAEVIGLKLKKERLIEEIGEYLGYDIDSRDPRFQEAVEQREKEKKKAAKAKKAKESYDKMITRLKQKAESLT